MTLQGWRMTTLVTCLIVVALLFNFGLSGWNPPAITHAIDATGRSSLILFAIAFTASSVESLWPSSLSRWSLRNRRWIGLSFASSHFIHLGLIISMTVLFPDPFVSEQSMAQWVFGGLAYGFIFLMALTSTDQAQRWMGMKNWTTSLCWKSLDLDAFFAHLCQTCQRRPLLVLSPLLAVHLGAGSHSIRETQPSQGSPRCIDVSGSFSCPFEDLAALRQ